MIYCVEDDLNILELLTYTLRQTGYEAKGFKSAREFYPALTHEKPQLVLLDIMLPDESGLEILKQLKSTITTSSIPVIMLTAKGSEYDKVIGLDLGADDYITKPFSMMELIARIKAVLRRSEDNGESEILKYKELTIDTKKHLVIVDDKKVVLTLKEYELLKKLMENPGIVLTREKLLEEIWGYDYYGDTRTVDVHIRHLRVKLEGEPKVAEAIETVRGIGYRLRQL